MLCSVKDLKGYELAADDGEIGHVKEIYFDDQYWVVRHLVVDTGGWLSGRRVFISPHSIRHVDHAKRRLQVSLTRSQVENAPGVETDKPVSRQNEIAVYDYYRYPYYWGGSGLWGMVDAPMGGVIAPVLDTDPAVVRELQRAEQEASDPHLRSSAEVAGYAVEARDGEIGHLDDFLFDERSWQIRFVIVDTNNWLPDRLVLVAPQWIEQIDWPGHRAVFRVSRKVVEASPPYTRGTPVTEEQQGTIQRHFEFSE